jgi:hypothetical protein
MPKNINYSFLLPNGVKHDFAFKLNTDTFEIETSNDCEYPKWTELTFHQCAHCPLTEERYCPAAISICNVVLPLDSLLSYETVTCKVETRERTTLTTTSAQEALRSMMMFVVSASACPHTDFAKPIANTHLPFVTLEEYMYRIVSTYLLYQHFRYKDGLVFDQNLDHLPIIVEKFQSIIRSMSDRLNAAYPKGDAGLNALVIFHGFTQFLPIMLEKHLAMLRPSFEPILRHDHQK